MSHPLPVLPPVVRTARIRGAFGESMDAATMTALLRRMESGERAAADELYAVLYDELRRRAGRLMNAGAGHTLQPTAVVHEAWMRLARGADQGFHSREHFLGVAASAMRSVLVDHARAARSLKRGGAGQRVPLDDAIALFETSVPDLLELDELLARLSGIDARLARIVELRFFAGLSIEETAHVLGISTASVERGWRSARAWLRVALDRRGTDGKA